jgi:asparaginyl-tRNA synthetase
VTDSPHKRLDFIADAAKRGIRDYYQQLGITPTQTPAVTAITGACENVDTLYRLCGHSGLYLAQTGQLSLEVKLQQHDGVYCEAFSFRDDPTDVRHLNQFYLIEEEFTCHSVGIGEDDDAANVMLDRLLKRITTAVCAMLRGVLNSSCYYDDFDYSHIEQAIDAAGESAVWPSITYRESIRRLNRTGRFPTLAFGADLSAEHEQAILSLVHSDHGGAAFPVFVTHYPETIKFFNMKVDPADCAVDLLRPAAGESVGAAVRENHFATLVRRLESSSMMRHLEAYGGQRKMDFGRYLEIVSNGRIPLHAGYGIGFERVLQFVLRAPDIRDVSEPYQLVRQLL